MVSRARWEFPELKRQAVALADVWRPHALLVEDAASGQSLIQALKADTRLPVLPIKPLGDKVARAHAVSPLIESGRVCVQPAAPWLADFLDELTSFPAAPHDDQVDALTQALNWLRGSAFSWEALRSAEAIHVRESATARGPRVGAFDAPYSTGHTFNNVRDTDAAEERTSGAATYGRAKWRGF